MSFSVSFVERRDPETSSIERVFETVGKVLAQRGIEIRHDKVPYGNSVLGIAANLFAKRPASADIFHITGHITYYALRLPRRKTVITFHDLQILRMRKGIRRFLIKKLFYVWPIKMFDHVTTISEQTKRELIELTGCPEEKIRVIENPLTVEVTPHPRPFNVAKPVILQIGTSQNKNLRNLISAVKDLDCTLRIVGFLDDVMVRELNESRVEFVNRSNLSADEILAEYMNADILCFCSTSEGFGLPIIEGQAMLVPVITSSISPMKEVAGEGALLADPNDPSDIRSAFLRLIRDEKLRNEIVRLGLENIKRFSPDRIARQYEEIYLRILDKNHLTLP